MSDNLVSEKSYFEDSPAEIDFMLSIFIYFQI